MVGRLRDRIWSLHLALKERGQQTGGSPDATSDLSEDVRDYLDADEPADALVLVLAATTSAIRSEDRDEAVSLWRSATGDLEADSAGQVDAWLGWDGVSEPPPYTT